MLMPIPAWSNGNTSSILTRDRPMELDAEEIEYDKLTNTYNVVGNATLKQDNTTVSADEFLLDMKNGYMKAIGNLKIHDAAGNLITGSSIELNMDQKTATLLDGSLFFKLDNAYVKGPVIQKTGPITYESAYVSVTTCDCDSDEEPAWSLTASKVKMKIEDHLSGRSVFFRIKDRPFFYLPYIRVPINTKRESGFLMPDFGFSELRGTKIDNSYFWAISDNTDATFYLDVETKRGTGQGMEFRGYRNRNSYAEASVYYFAEKDIERVREFRSGQENLSRPESASNDRWEFNLEHYEHFSKTFNAKSNLRIVSDDEYYLDNSRDQNNRSLEGLESTFSITKNWKRASLVTEFRWFDNLTIEDDKTVLQRLPELHLTVTGRKVLNTPLYFAMNSTAINFMRKSGVEGGRFDIQPRFSIPMRPAGLFELTPTVTPRWTGYALTGPSIENSPDRVIYEFRTDAVTTFLRRFNTKGGLTHSVRPQVSYRFIPDEDQSTLPQFDSSDMIEAKNEVLYAINTTLASMRGEGDKRARHEYLFLELEESYDLSEERKESVPDVKKRPFSEVRGELILRPLRTLTLSSSGHFDVYHTRFSDLVSTLSLSDKRGDHLTVTHSMDRDVNSRYIQGDLRFKIIKPIALTFSQRYSLADERSLETTYGFFYDHQCWGFDLTYSENLSEKLMLLQFSLKGIGNIIGLKTAN